MERLTMRVNGFAHGAEGRSVDKLTGEYCRGNFEATACIDRLAAYEDAEEKVREVHNSDFGLIELADLYVGAVTSLNGGKKPRRIVCLSDGDADIWEEWKELKRSLEKEIFRQEKEETSGVIRRVDELGRIVLPKEIRNVLGISDGTPMEICVSNGRVVLKRHYAEDALSSVVSILAESLEERSEDLEKGKAEDIRRHVREIQKLLKKN